MTQTHTLAVTGDWLNTNTQTQLSATAQGDFTGGTITNCVIPLGPYNPWPYYGWPSYYVSYSGPSRPIKLTLSEVERLRAAAKRDAKLKAIIAKFTECIQIEVDFE